MKHILAPLFNLSTAKAAQWEPLIVEALERAECDSKQRVVCFLAQVGHESGNLRWLKEIWGPTSQQLRYDGTKLAERLGNTSSGDGKRFMGRGLIQLTGRANYTWLGSELDVDLIQAPELLETPRLAALSAAVFWTRRRLNSYADEYDFGGLTKRINGGLNGLAHRQALYTKASILC